MADEAIAININYVIADALNQTRELERRSDRAADSAERLGAAGRRAGNAISRGMARGRAAFRGMNGVIRRTLRTLVSLRTLSLSVLGVLAGSLVNSVIDRFQEFERSQIRAFAALRAAQQRFGASAGTIRRLQEFTGQLRREFRQLSTIELNNTVAGAAELQRNFGLAGSQAETLVRRIIDIAAATGRTVDDVTARIRSGFLGSTEAIEDLGVNFLVSRLDALSAAQGYNAAFRELDSLTQAQVRFGALLTDTNELQGVAARLADTFSGRLQTLKAAFSDLVLLAGSLLVRTPAFQTVLEGTSDLVGFLRGELQTLSGPARTVLNVLNSVVGTIAGLANAVRQLFSELPGLTGADLLNPQPFLQRISDAFSRGSGAFSLTPVAGSVLDISEALGGDASKRFVDVPVRLDVAKALADAQGVVEAVEAQLRLARPPQVVIDVDANTEQLRQSLEEMRRQGGNNLLFDPKALRLQIDQAGESLRAPLRQLLSELARTEDIGRIGGLQQQISQIGQLKKNIDLLSESLQVAEERRAGFEIGLARFAEGTLIDFSDQMRNVFLGVFSLLGNLISDAAAGTQDSLKRFLAGLLAFLGDFAIRLGALMILLGLGINSLFTLNPGALIAIGAALIAIGGLLKGFSQSLGGFSQAGGNGAAGSNAAFGQPGNALPAFVPLGGVPLGPASGAASAPATTASIGGRSSVKLEAAVQNLALTQQELKHTQIELNATLRSFQGLPPDTLLVKALDRPRVRRRISSQVFSEPEA